MKKNYFFAGLMALGMSLTSIAQTRYVDEVFSDVTVTSNVVYGQNTTVLPALLGAPPQVQPLIMDVYEPTSDTASSRPVFMYIHTGNFLPMVTNGSLVGTLRDSAVTEICTRLAKMGYVAVSIDYRTGWNPLATTQTERTKLLLQAVYRAVQDGRTAVRYLRKDAAESGNTYGIDESRIGVIGEGSGGYVAYAMATLDKLSEVQLDKFIDFTDPVNPVPFVDTMLMGDFEGLGDGVMIPGTSVSTNVPNNPGYNSNIQFCVNLGGAMGDSTWLEAGDVPMVSFHCPNDPFAPYNVGTVVVPTTQANVVEVAGSYKVQQIANAFGNNDPFTSVTGDVYTTAANVNNDGFDGLFPFITPTPESAPYQWWNPASDTSAGMTVHQSGLLTNPTMSATKGRTYIDTIIGYLAPRALEGFVNHTHVPATVNELVSGTVNVFPNPASSILNVESDNKINGVNVFNITGSLVASEASINSTRFEFNTQALPSGIYYLQVNTIKGTEVHKVIFE